MPLAQLHAQSGSNIELGMTDTQLMLYLWFSLNVHWLTYSYVPLFVFCFNCCICDLSYLPQFYHLFAVQGKKGGNFSSLYHDIPYANISKGHLTSISFMRVWIYKIHLAHLQKSKYDASIWRSLLAFLFSVKAVKFYVDDINAVITKCPWIKISITMSHFGNTSILYYVQYFICLF